MKILKFADSSSATHEVLNIKRSLTNGGCCSCCIVGIWEIFFNLAK